MVRIGVVRCLVAAVLFGASAPAASVLAGEAPALVLAGLLYLGAGLAVLPTSLRNRPSPGALARDWKPTAVAVVAGGAIGPVLLVAGLARTSAATASILLNLELVATVAIAGLVFREHLGVRMLAAAASITAAGGLLAWDPAAGAGVSWGALLIALACVAWGVDNAVTAGIDQLTAEHVVVAKGLVAGSANLVLGLGLVGAGGLGIEGVAAALLVGAVGYGASITLWVRGARELGSARGQVIFAAAPFIGTAVSWLVLGEAVRPVQVLATVVAAAGVAVSLNSAHHHPHDHVPLVHEHEHRHDDDHHDHDHDGPVPTRHSHRHRHRALTHAHPHVPDLHHRHD